MSGLASESNRAVIVKNILSTVMDREKCVDFTDKTRQDLLIKSGDCSILMSTSANFHLLS